MAPSCDGDGDGDDEVAAKKIQSPPFRSTGPSCDGAGGAGGEVAAARGELSSDASAGAGGEEDRLSALPDDMLVLILDRLNTAAAARTRVLSRRWRRVWALLPGLSFGRRWRCAPDPRQMGLVLEAHEAALQHLLVFTKDATPDSVAAWLPAAARRVSGTLAFANLGGEGSAQEGGDDDDEEAGQRGAFELPCLERATIVKLLLGLAGGFLGLAVPPAGVFSRLTEFSLDNVRLHGPGDLGDVVSWPRCPCLKKFTVRNAMGLDNLAIHSNSLQQVKLIGVQGLRQLNIAIHSNSLQQVELTSVQVLRQLNIVAPALEELKVERCFLDNGSQPVASITAPQLAILKWPDSYDPNSVHFGEMSHVRLLRPIFFTVYADEDDNSTHNQSCLSLLRYFKVVECLKLTLTYQLDIDDYDYVMEEMTMLPDITILHLDVLANRHAFGASAFHVLRMCCSINSLILSFLPLDAEVEAQITCPPGCICGEHESWDTEHLLLNRLKEVEVTGMRGSEHEVTFVKQLFNWATSLENMRVVFHASITESVAKELSQVLRSFAKPGIRMETYGFVEDYMLKLYSRKKGASS